MSAFLGGILNWVLGFIGNYGWSVIVFSILVKCVLLPLDVKSRRSMRAMSKLAPQMEALKKRYANDQEKLNQKTSELYKKNKVNPLSGCLPMLIQFPILIAMFNAMRDAAAEKQLIFMAEWIKANLIDTSVIDQLKFLSPESDAVKALIERISTGDASVFQNMESWLWVKNVYQPDSFMKAAIPNVSELATLLKSNGKGLEEAQRLILEAYTNLDLSNSLGLMVDNAIISQCGFTKYPILFSFSVSIPSNWTTYVNGWLLLPVLAAVTQFLSTKFQPTSADSGNSQQGGAGKFMKWFFPFFSLWICFSSTAAFAIYWVFVNVWSIFTSFAINKFLEIKEKNNQLSSEEALQP